MSTDLSDAAAQRAVIEAELHARLERDRHEAASRGGVGAAVAAAATTVGLRCLACQGESPGDARFCKHCGVRFNAQVVGGQIPSPPEGTA